MTEKGERLEFLYNPKALSEYDNEKYLLGENIPQDKSKIVGEFKNNDKFLDSKKDNSEEIDDKEILNRLREDPMLIIKRIELKHKKINEEYIKKKTELSSLETKNMIRHNFSDEATKRRRNRERSSFSRSPERFNDPSNCKSNNRKSSQKISRNERLQEMIKNSKDIQNQRIDKYINNDTYLQKEEKCHFYNSSYLREMIEKINYKKTNRFYKK